MQTNSDKVAMTPLTTHRDTTLDETESPTPGGYKSQGRRSRCEIIFFITPTAIVCFSCIQMMDEADAFTSLLTRFEKHTAR